MLSRIHNKLTMLYTVVFGGFLLGFILIISIANLWSLYYERVEEVELLAGQIAKEQHDVIKQHDQNHESLPTNLSIEDNYDISGQVFYYLFDQHGEMIKADLPVPILRDPILARVANWDDGQQTSMFTIAFGEGKSAAVILTVHRIFRDDELVGTVFVGKDLTAYFRTLEQSAVTILIAAVGFILLAALIGYILAGRVLIPIEKSINRQKQFVADASHELRTPLSVLQTSIEAIELDEDNKLSVFSEQILEDVKDEMQRIKRLISNLLTLARADTGDISIKKTRIPLNEIVEQILRSLKIVARQKFVQFQLITPEEIEITADAQRIEQLIYILVDNGIKYTPEHGVVIIRLERTEIGGNSGVKIIVEDTGPGVSPEDYERIFERFFRADKARSRNTQGVGLGLSIAKWIVDAHKGSIYVKNNTGGGSSFVVIIPD